MYVSNGSLHPPHQWIVEVYVYGIKFISGAKSNKREAEQEAACFAYTYARHKWDPHADLIYPTEAKTDKHIDERPDLQIDERPDLQIDERPDLQIDERPRRFAFIDLENIQPNIPSNLHNTNSYRAIYGFHSTYATIDLSRYKTHMNLISVDSPVTEAADHLLTYHIGKLIGGHKISKNDQLAVVSRDKASAIIVHMLTIDGYKVDHYKSARDFESSL